MKVQKSMLTLTTCLSPNKHEPTQVVSCKLPSSERSQHIIQFAIEKLQLFSQWYKVIVLLLSIAAVYTSAHVLICSGY